MLWKSPGAIKIIPSNFKWLAPIGLFSALSLVLEMITLSLTLVAYTYAIKRTSILMSVFFGHLIFKEKGLKERLTGAAIMVAGVLIIALLAK